MAKEQNKTVVTETINGNLVVIREAILGKNKQQLKTQDGRLYYNYVVRGVIRGQEKTIRFAPKDKGGYEPLDILFDISDKAELIIYDEVSEFDGKKTVRMAYKVQVADEDGEVWECNVKPERDSAKALLNFLLISLGKTQKAASSDKATA